MQGVLLEDSTFSSWAPTKRWTLQTLPPHVLGTCWSKALGRSPPGGFSREGSKLGSVFPVQSLWPGQARGLLAFLLHIHLFNRYLLSTCWWWKHLGDKREAVGASNFPQAMRKQDFRVGERPSQRE